MIFINHLLINHKIIIIIVFISSIINKNINSKSNLKIIFDLAESELEDNIEID